MGFCNKRSVSLKAVSEVSRQSSGRRPYHCRVSCNGGETPNVEIGSKIKIASEKNHGHGKRKRRIQNTAEPPTVHPRENLTDVMWKKGLNFVVTRDTHYSSAIDEQDLVYFLGKRTKRTWLIEIEIRLPKIED